MDLQFQNTSSSAKFVIVGLFLMVSYLIYSLTVSIYKSYQIDIHIKQFEAENKRIEDENRKQSEDFEYFSSSAYIEKIAKQNLGLLNRGEEIIIIPGEAFDEGVSGVESLDENERPYSGQSNPSKWWKFFFDRESVSN